MHPPTHAHTRLRPLLYALLVVLAAGPRGDPGEPTEWEREAPPGQVYLSPRNAEGTPTHVVVRVVDDLTGAGLRGATANLVSQTEYPVTGLVAADRVGVADADGWIRIRADDLGWEPDWVGGYHLYVEAPGHAGAYAHNAASREGQEVRLQRARDVVVRVADALDRPVAGALVGVRDASTCGHMPDQRIAVSDLDGMAVLRGLCPRDLRSDVNEGWETWVVEERLESAYDTLEIPTLRGRPQVLRFGASYPIVGVVLDAKGRPQAGVPVGGQGGHRGPWTTTDEDGRFRLVGADPYHHAMQVHDPLQDSSLRGPHVMFKAPPRGVQRVIHLPPLGEKLPAETEHPVTIHVLDAADGEPLDDEPTIAWRDGDGWTARTRGAPEKLPAGTYTLEAGGGPSAFARGHVRLEVAADTATEVELRLTRHPLTRLECLDDPHEVLVTLVTPEGERTLLTDDDAVPDHVALPPHVPCVLRVDCEVDGRQHTELVPIPEEARGPFAPPVRIHATRVTTLRAHLVGPGGQPVEGWLLLPGDEWPDETRGPVDVAPGTEPEMTCFEEGELEVDVFPRAPGLLPRRVRVTVPPGSRGQGAVDVGTIQMLPRGDRRLAVLDVDGAPLDVDELIRVRGDDVQQLYADETGLVDDRFEPLQEGDVVMARKQWIGEASFAGKLRLTLQGPGPWVLQPAMSGATLAVDVRDLASEPLEGIVVVDGVPYRHASEAYDGRIAVVGLEPGPHVVAVGAVNHVSRLYSVQLEEGAARMIDARLRPAP